MKEKRFGLCWVARFEVATRCCSSAFRVDRESGDGLRGVEMGWYEHWYGYKKTEVSRLDLKRADTTSLISIH